MSVTELCDSDQQVLLVTMSVRRDDIDEAAGDPRDTLTETTDVTSVSRPVCMTVHNLLVRGAWGRVYQVVVTARTELVGGPS